MKKKKKKKRGNKTRETYQPRIAELASDLDKTNYEISALELSLAKKYNYHAGLLKKPDNTKHLQFSGQKRSSELGREIEEKEKQLESISRNQKVAQHCKVLAQLVELKVQFLDILKTEKSELDSACWSLFYGS